MLVATLLTCQACATPLHDAVRSNDIPDARSLLMDDAWGELLLSKLPGIGETALHTAVFVLLDVLISRL